MPKAEILKIVQAVWLVIATQDITDEQAQALLRAAAKSTRLKRKRKGF